MLLVKRNELIAKELLSSKVQISTKPFEQGDELQEYKDKLSQCCRNDGCYDEVVKILRENPSLMNAIVSKNVRKQHYLLPSSTQSNVSRKIDSTDSSLHCCRSSSKENSFLSDPAASN
jgi:hypothetical protein